jgi:DNA polymerase III alpha subunit
LKAYEVKDFNRYISVNHGEETVFHRLRQRIWNMPEKYQDLDIQEYLINRMSLCSNPEYAIRLSHELDLFEQYNLLDLLRYMKYMTDIFRKNNVVWGVGRGSSVASLCLFLLDVHCVDPVAYDISFDEFLK